MLTLNVSGIWKTVQYAYVNVNGSWKTVAQIYVNVTGSWKPIWSYSWSSGSWGSCSADCGGGTQTRTVTCSRNDGQTVSDSICTSMVGTKPSTSQECNTDSCLSCSNNPGQYVASITGYCIMQQTFYSMSGGGGADSYYVWDSNGNMLCYTTGYSLSSVTCDSYKYTISGSAVCSFHSGDGIYISISTNYYAATRSSA